MRVLESTMASMLCRNYQQNNPEQRRLNLQKQLDAERARARRSENDLWEAQFRIQELEKLNARAERQWKAMEIERDQATVEADHLRRQLRKLRSETKSSQKSIHAAFQRLTHDPAVAKRIAAACHPDKCPKELADVATQLFRFVQAIRERQAQ